MNADEMRQKTQALAIRIIRMVERLPKTRTVEIIGKQLIRYGTSVGANYRVALRSRSRADFLNKLGIVEEEADETIFWREVLIGADIVKRERLTELIRSCQSSPRQSKPSRPAKTRLAGKKRIEI